jgi:HPt (histidine-containing phosphotransfer) domain-containing protein
VLSSFRKNWHELRDDRFDPVSLWARVGQDPELLGELVGIFAEEGPILLEQIRLAIKNNDTLVLRKASHKLKGSVLQFSAGRAIETAAKLEQLGRNHSVAGALELFQDLEIEVGWLIKMLKTMADTDLH